MCEVPESFPVFLRFVAVFYLLATTNVPLFFLFFPPVLLKTADGGGELGVLVGGTAELGLRALYSPFRNRLSSLSISILDPKEKRYTCTCTCYVYRPRITKSVKVMATLYNSC